MPALGFALLTWSGTARAEQFTMFDVVLDVTMQNTRDAHFSAKPPAYMFMQPDNWTAPIDYTKGTVVIEHESIMKPSEEPTQIDVCFMTSKGYGCRNTINYSKPGRYQTVRPVTSFYGFNRIDWTKKIPEIQFVTKDANNVNGGREKNKFIPHKTRIAMTFVSAGSTYVPPAGWSALPPDGGATPAPGDAGAGPGPAEAGTSEVGAPAEAGAGGAGGTAGTGGATGSGGSAGTGGSSGSSSGGSTGSSSGGASGSSSGGSTGSGSPGTGGTRKPDPTPPVADPGRASPEGPCSVAVGRAPFRSGGLALAGLALIALVLRRRSR